MTHFQSLSKGCAKQVIEVCQYYIEFKDTGYLSLKSSIQYMMLEMIRKLLFLLIVRFGDVNLNLLGSCWLCFVVKVTQCHVNFKNFITKLVHSITKP